MPGTLILCAGPIGNLDDISTRLAETLRSVDVVFAEDTRRARTLLEKVGADVDVRSYFVGNEEERAAEISQRLESDQRVALVTDAGTPGISDPGVSAVRAAVTAGAVVTGVPGPSAVTLALAVSGESGDRFVFEGFLPKKGSERSSRVENIAGELRTVVLFAAPSRLVRDLEDLWNAHRRTRRCVVGRELTKLHEEVWRGTLEDAVRYWSGQERVRGEVTVVLGALSPPPPDFAGAVAQARRLIDDGTAPSEAVRRVAEASGVSRRELYAAVIG